MSKKDYTDYDYLDVEVIKEACKGKENALEKVIFRYENYAKTCLRQIARSEFGLDERFIPFDDLLQTMWMELIKVIVTKFKIAD